MKTTLLLALLVAGAFSGCTYHEQHVEYKLSPQQVQDILDREAELVRRASGGK